MPASLSLSLLSDMAVLTPNLKSSHPLGRERTCSEPTFDAQLAGVATLDLPKETRFKRIIVVLVRSRLPLAMQSC